jgi:AraC-like DNA-binding protein
MEKKLSVTFHDLAESREFAEFFAILHDLTGTVIGLSAPGWREVKGPVPEMTAPVCQVVNATEAGHAACVRENLRHTEEALGKGEPVHYICHAGLVDFMVPICVEGHHVATIEGGQLMPAAPTEEGFRELCERTASYGLDREKLREAYFGTTPMPEEKITAIVSLVRLFGQHFTEFAWQLEELRDERRHPAVTRAMEYISQHYRERIGLSGVADVVRLSPSYLSARFSRETGMTLTQFIHRTRVERAKRLLRDTDKSVSEIAFDVGFQNVTHFNYVFRKVEGGSPSRYRSFRPDTSRR